MLKMPKISIIIPFKGLDKKVEECISGCLNLNYKNYDTILLPDKIIKYRSKKIRIIPTGEVYPSIKRNIGVKKSNCDIIAFIDSDAYPDKNWLKNAYKLFEDKKIGAVGGPKLAPKNAPLKEKVAIDVVYSRFGTEACHFIKSKKKLKEYLELESSNLLVRKDLFLKVGGFDSSILTGEDSKLCYQIRNLGKKIIFSEEVIVYHHRRPLFLPHLNRIAVQGKNKAYVLKKMISFDKLIFFIPTLFVFFLVFGFLLSFFSSLIRIIYIAFLLLYLLLVLLESLKVKNLKRIYYMSLGIILTHIFYGIGFLIGLLDVKHKLK